jgi:hypothetical protein
MVTGPASGTLKDAIEWLASAHNFFVGLDSISLVESVETVTTWVQDSYQTQ